jgi:membrane protease YdiL (CAAX protease family)
MNMDLKLYTGKSKDAMLKASLIKPSIILWIACIIGSLAILPYLLTLQSLSFSNFSLGTYLIQNILIYAFACIVGNFFAKKAKLSIYVKNQYWVLPALGGGILAGALLVFFQFIVFPQSSVTHPSWTLGLLASLYGAINEEVLIRLLLMSSVVWCIQKITRSTQESTYWIAIIVTTLLFGAGHLPAAFKVLGDTYAVMIQILLLNGIAGVVFGYLFWRYNLMAAMLAHFVADIIIHVLIPLF